MAEEGTSSEPVKKKTRLSGGDILEIFHQKYNNLTTLREACTALFKEKVVRSLTLRSCNANDSHPAKSFKNASCDMECQTTTLAYGDLFLKGMKILLDFVVQKIKPKNQIMQNIVECLLTYLMDTESQKKLDRLDKKDYSEAVLTAVLLNHLFLRLSPVQQCTMDIGKEMKGLWVELGTPARLLRCPCEMDMKCSLCKNIVIGDTSIGNRNVWHGSMDCLLGGVAIENFKPEPDSPGIRSCFEYKKKFLEKVDMPVQRIVAQSIVFSFLRSNIEPDITLVPTIAVSAEEIAIYFYDSKNDILLKSSASEFSEAGSERLQVILMAWLAVNYEYLGSNPLEELNDKIKGSNFVNLVSDKIEVFKSGLEYSIKRSKTQWKEPPMELVIAPSRAKYLSYAEVN